MPMAHHDPSNVLTKTNKKLQKSVHHPTNTTKPFSINKTSPQQKQNEERPCHTHPKFLTEPQAQINPLLEPQAHTKKTQKTK
jgi:hypothetical protein